MLTDATGEIAKCAGEVPANDQAGCRRSKRKDVIAGRRVEVGVGFGKGATGGYLGENVPQGGRFPFLRRRAPTAKKGSEKVLCVRSVGFRLGPQNCRGITDPNSVLTAIEHRIESGRIGMNGGGGHRAVKALRAGAVLLNGFDVIGDE
jgi:hypothetical protein